MLPVQLWADCAFCLHPFSYFTKCLPWTGAMLLLLGIDIWFKSLLHWKKWVVKSWNQGKSMKTSRDYNVECKVLLILAIPEIGIFNHFDQPSNNKCRSKIWPTALYVVKIRSNLILMFFSDGNYQVTYMTHSFSARRKKISRFYH